MNDSLLDKYTRRPGEPDPALEADDDFGSFGWLRGMRERAVMLELRHKTGNVTAIAYAMIEKLEFNPSEGITIHALGQKIRIQGRNLNAEVRPTVRLFEGLTRHRIPWVRESAEPDRLESTGTTAVERIEL